MAMPQTKAAMRPLPKVTWACEIVTEKAQTLAEAWSLIAFLFREIEYDEKAWKKVMREGVADRLRQVAGALAELGAWDAKAIETALGGLPDALGVKPGA